MLTQLFIILTNYLQIKAKEQNSNKDNNILLF